jgi:nucleoside-diphosphate-sugar epimerase
MRTVIAGGHGKIALLLSRQLADAGHTPVGLIRNPDQSYDVIEAGAEPVVIDLEHSTVEEVSAVLTGADSVVFAAGAGAGSGNERKMTIDRDGAILLADAAVASGIRRMIVVSSAGADDDTSSVDADFAVYLQAKREADEGVKARRLDWTIIRPTGLTDEPAKGLVTLGDPIERGTIPRADVAALIVATLGGLAVHKQFEATSGGTPIAEALAAL